MPKARGSLFVAAKPKLLRLAVSAATNGAIPATRRSAKNARSTPAPIQIFALRTPISFSARNRRRPTHEARAGGASPYARSLRKVGRRSLQVYPLIFSGHDRRYRI